MRRRMRRGKRTHWCYELEWGWKRDRILEI